MPARRRTSGRCCASSSENGATAHPDVMALVTKIDSFDISELGHTHLIAGRLF